MSATPVAVDPPAPLHSVPEAGRPTLVGAPQGGRRSAGADAALLTGGTYVANVLQFVAGLAQKALLGPVGAGYWALMQTFWTFFSFSSLGAQQGAFRQVPMHRGRRDFDAAAQAAGTGASFALVAVSVLSLVVATVAIVFGGGWAPQVRFGLVLLCATAPLRSFTDLHDVLFQSIKRFDVSSATAVLQAAVSLVAQTLAVWWLGFYGLFLGLVITQLAAFVLWWRLGVISRSVPAFRFGIDRARLREVIRFGGPVMIWGQLWLVFVAVDSLVVAGALDARRLGFYALAVSVTSYVLYLPKSIGAALSPRMMERFSRTQSLADIHHYATDVQRVMAFLLVPLTVGAGYFGMPVVVRHVLPDFAPAIEVVQIMVAASFLMALMNMPVKVLITAGHRWSLIALVCVALAINLGLNLLAVVILEEGITGAAVATAGSYLATFLLITGYTLTRALPVMEVLRHVGALLAAGVYTYGALRLVETLLGDGQGVIADAGLGLAKFTLFALLMAPWFVLAERSAGALTLIRGLIRRAR